MFYDRIKMYVQNWTWPDHLFNWYRTFSAQGSHNVQYQNEEGKTCIVMKPDYMLQEFAYEYEHVCVRVCVCHCASMCVRVKWWVCACIQHLPAANEWQPTSPAGPAVLGYEAGAGCFLMVITHFVPGLIILHWLCLRPRGEPHKVDPVSQSATKTQMH